jgi:hypothetical protein
VEHDSGIGIQIIGRNRSSLSDRSCRQAVFPGETLLLPRPTPNFCHEVVTNADRCYGNYLVRCLVDQADPYHPKAAFIGRNPAGLAEEFITVTGPHYECIDSAQHGVHPIKVDDASFRFLSIGHIAHH